MLYDVAEIANESRKRGDPYWSATLESLLVHVRILLDFFAPRPKSTRNDDIIAADFFVGQWDVPRWSVPLSPLRDRIDKQLAHLTYSRKVGESWDVRQLVSLFEEPLKRFLSTVDAALLDDAWAPIRSGLRL
jgi:hypothetical protein